LQSGETAKALIACNQKYLQNKTPPAMQFLIEIAQLRLREHLPGGSAIMNRICIAD